jgi:site-specific recombinase XerC
MTPIAPLITAYLREHMPVERGLSPHTCDTYAHAFRLLFRSIPHSCSTFLLTLNSAAEMRLRRGTPGSRHSRRLCVTLDCGYQPLCNR